MKAHTRWLACDTCSTLRHHVLDATGMTPFEKTARIQRGSAQSVAACILWHRRTATMQIANGWSVLVSCG